MKSSDHRGTVDEPGRVPTLVQGEATDTVAGVTYDIPEEKFDETLKALDYRERHGYTRTPEAFRFLEPTFGVPKLPLFDAPLRAVFSLSN